MLARRWAAWRREMETLEARVLLAAGPSLAWASYLGGTNDDAGYSIAVDPAGNTFVTGATKSTNIAGRLNDYHGGENDAFVAKISAGGTVLWVSYLGGTGDDQGYGIAVDSSGNAVVCGFTDSANFFGTSIPYHGGSDDMFVAKVSTAGALVFATYIGGTGTDTGRGVTVDASGNIFAVGQTGSNDVTGANNTSHGSAGDALVAKVYPGGDLVWATYLGGSGDDEARSVVVDITGDAFVTGITSSNDFSGAINTYHGGANDAFVAKVTAAGAVVHATYLGGSGEETGEEIAIDGAGNALITGGTGSADFAGANNATHGAEDAFVAKVLPIGGIAWATYLGGSGGDFGVSLAVDAVGDALVTGGTTGANFAGANNSGHGNNDGFVAKVTSAGALAWATYLGGSDIDYGFGIALDGSGNAYVTGETHSSDFAGAINGYSGIYDDAFVVKLAGAATPSPAGHLLGVGTFCDAAYTSMGRLYVAWRDPAAQNLKLMSRSPGGTWSNAIVIDGNYDGGTYVSLAIDRNDRPALAWYDASNADLRGWFYFEGVGFRADRIAFTGRVGMYPSLAFDAGNMPVITYYDRTHGDLMIASWRGAAWKIGVIDSTGDCGRYSSLAMDPTTGRWAVAYEQTTGGLFRYAQQTRTGWALTTVDDTRIGGGFISLAIASDGSSAFSYYDAYNGDLKAAQYDGAWMVNTVAARRTQGLYTNSFVDSSGAMSIYYYDRSANRAMLAGNGNGGWNVRTVRGGAGAQLSVTLRSGTNVGAMAWLDLVTGQLVVDDLG